MNKATIFLAIPHVEDNDADYLSFSTLDAAIAYLKEHNELESFILSRSFPEGVGMAESEFTFIA